DPLRGGTGPCPRRAQRSGTHPARAPPGERTEASGQGKPRPAPARAHAPAPHRALGEVHPLVAGATLSPASRRACHRRPAPVICGFVRGILDTVVCRRSLLRKARCLPAILRVWFHVRDLGENGGEGCVIRTSRTSRAGREIVAVAVSGHCLTQRVLGKSVHGLFCSGGELREFAEARVVEMEFQSGHGIGGSIARNWPGVMAFG
ncbi:MAG: hypothetical protein DVB27_01775, partial [Verrucomicrobia bacterium]